ncbi:carbohydrate ABC transporter permease [Paenibacillus thermoaerophilus]|uniref:Carbohydrate ABC transporter permease n=1 Tax=Paenibacillus thermoaerophilus TaxID=1215385 RepID=A0ABW2V0I9_9BACL|nr:sugar ABC transporter permease [Paenibacillus thermoaerophilus]TMV11016.1 sugar ABC transporter permease [Paenibacillus thermoaerophilus]
MKAKRSLEDWLHQFTFVAPAFVFFAAVMLVPFALTFYYSFTSWNGVSNEVSWVGLANFKQIFANDSAFFDSFSFTARYTIVSVVLVNLAGFLLALLLTRPLKSRNGLRTVFFMPNVIGGLLLGFIWNFIFVRGFSAIGNATGIGFFNLPWLGDASTSFWAMVIVTVWQQAGYLMVIYIAALSNMPKDVIEAAKVDGASSLQTLWRIVVPLIMPAVTVSLFLAISWSFKVFDLNLSLTKGGPFRSTESVAMNIYNEAFQNNRFGLGTAKALIFFIVVAIITSIQVAITKKREVEA